MTSLERSRTLRIWQYHVGTGNEREFTGFQHKVMSWRTLTEMALELGLKSPTADVAALREELRQRLKLVHPDHHPDSPQSSTEKLQVATLTAALDFLDSHEKGQTARSLVARDADMSLLPELNRSLAVINKALRAFDEITRTN